MKIRKYIAIASAAVLLAAGGSALATRAIPSEDNSDTDSIEEIAIGVVETDDAPEEAPAVPKYRFHCEKDTIEIGEMLGTLWQHRDLPIADIAVKAAELLEGRPYVGHTLEGDVEQLVINVDQLDCVTFVENCFALAMTVKEGRRSWREFSRNIESLRYRKGVQKGYDSRLHYTTDWITDNVYRGNISDVTPMLPGAKSLTKTLNFMTRHRDLYPALQDEEVYQRCREIEEGLRSMRIPYMTKESANQKNVIEELRDGDMISFVSPKEGLDSSHVALLRIINGKPYMMHASLKGKKVVFEKEPLYSYLKYYKRDAPGFRVLRLREQ